MNNANSQNFFHYVEGKGWKIVQNYTHPVYGSVHVSRQYYRTKSDAKADYERVLETAIDRARKKYEAKFFPNKVSTWDQFLRCFKEERLTEVRGSTWRSKDKPMLNKFFIPAFCGKDLQECFSEDTARALKAQIMASKTQWGDDTPKTDKNRAIALYLRMLEFAYENDYCTDMAAYRHDKAIMKKIRVMDETGCGHKRPAMTLTLAQLDSLLSAIEEGSPDYVLTKMMFMTGLRIGELLAVYPEDIDFDSGILTMGHLIAPDEYGNLKRFARAKTRNGMRKIPITEDITSLLQSYIIAHGIKDDEFLFPGIEEGKPLDRSAYARRLKRYCKMAGVPEINPHAARHTFSTIAHELGYPSEVIAMILGHTITVDVNIYNHLGNLERGRAMIDNMFKERAHIA